MLLTIVSALTLSLLSPYAKLDAIKSRSFKVLDSACGLQDTPESRVAVIDHSLSPFETLDLIKTRAFFALDAAIAKPVRFTSTAAIEDVVATCAPVSIERTSVQIDDAQPNTVAGTSASVGDTIVAGTVVAAAAIVGYQLRVEPEALSVLASSVAHIGDSLANMADVMTSQHTPAAADLTPLTAADTIDLPSADLRKLSLPPLAALPPSPLAALPSWALRLVPLLAIAAATSTNGGRQAVLVWPAQWNLGPKLTSGAVRIRTMRWPDSPGCGSRNAYIEAKIPFRKNPIGSCGLELLDVSARGLTGDAEFDDEFGGRRSRAVLTGMLLVREEFRRQGVAQRLLHEAEMRARWWGAAEMLLMVKRSNEAALRLYEKLGYRRMPHSMYHGDEVCMRKCLFLPTRHTLRALMPQYNVVAPRCNDQHPNPRTTDPHSRTTDPHPRTTDPHPRTTDPHPRITDPHPRTTAGGVGATSVWAPLRHGSHGF